MTDLQLLQTRQEDAFSLPEKDFNRRQKLLSNARKESLHNVEDAELRARYEKAVYEAANYQYLSMMVVIDTDALGPKYEEVTKAIKEKRDAAQKEFLQKQEELQKKFEDMQKEEGGVKKEDVQKEDGVIPMFN